MSSADTQRRVASRLTAAGLLVPPHVLEGCSVYLELLARWNARMNLTALPLGDPLPDVSIDKLIIEPLCGLSLLPEGTSSWIDLGSGGGSPAIPLRLAYPHGSLTMVESRERKCAFLREAVRILGLLRTSTASTRFETFSPSSPADLISIRAVRLDRPLTDLIARWLGGRGRLMCFGADLDAGNSGFSFIASTPLPDGSMLKAYSRVSD